MDQTLKVANFFVLKGIEDKCPVTLMKIMKLPYFAQGLSLAFFDKPIISEDFQAWKYGPVLKSIYDLGKYYGSKPIKGPLPGDFEDTFTPSEFDEIESKVLRAVWQKWGHLDALALSAMTHAAGSPWQRAYLGEQHRNSIITKESISEYFKQVYKK